LTLLNSQRLFFCIIMLDEARKREKAANAFLAATMALSAAQSPKDFVKTGKIESPGVALMQRWGRVREQLRRQPQGGGGSGAKDGKPGELRGKKRVPGGKVERDWNTDGPSPAMKVGWAKSARANKGKDIFSRKTTL
jgi:hypothetical protein